MRTISTELELHLSGSVTTLATCWKVTRQDGITMGFTDHSGNLQVQSVTYEASSGFTPTAIASSADLSVDNLDLEGMLSADTISEEDIFAGKYDFAEIEIFQVNYADLSQGTMVLSRGTLGEVRMMDHRFVVEVRGLSQQLSQSVGEVFSPSCRTALGDSKCGVNLASYTVTGTITEVTDQQSIADSSRGEDDGYFNYGKITFTSGANTGFSMEVKRFVSGGSISLVLPMPYPVDVGDGYSMHAGCDKTFGTCISRFSNAVNFRGEPHVPGVDRMLETAGTRSEWS